MYFLLSGEGSTDLGIGHGPGISEGGDFQIGPMAIVVDRIVEARLGCSIFDGGCGYVAGRELVREAAGLKRRRKAIDLPGKKRRKETGYYFRNSRVLARLAINKAIELNDPVVAVLFRDGDGTASAERGEWEDKRISMLRGFEIEGFGRGVPMIPKPKSEAWLICAWKAAAYQGCEELEKRSGNDDSPRSLKMELRRLVGGELTRESLCQRVEESFEIDSIRMPSFRLFRERLEEVIG